jgi:tripartite-type tricarboxylate transporter receptor subunit TctC
MLQADSSGWKPLVDGGQLKLLAIWTAERSAVWKDAPTLKELGYPFVFDSPFGVAGPKGMDPAIVKTLADAFKKAMAEPNVVEALRKYDMFPRFLDTADYKKVMADLVRDEGKALTDLGLAKKE